MEDFAKHYGVSEAQLTQELGDTFEGSSRSLLQQLREAHGLRGKLGPQDIAELALQNKTSQAVIRQAAVFIQHSETRLRPRAWMTGYLHGMELMNWKRGAHEQGERFLIDYANRFVATTQFIYSNSDRPLILATNLGKIFGRFKLWVYRSANMSIEVGKAAYRDGLKPGTYGHKLAERYLHAMLFVMVLGEYFPFSLFDSTLPAPADQLTSLATLFFGDDESRDDAFYGYGNLGIPGVLYSQLKPVSARVPEALFRGVLSGEWREFADYHLWNMAPFGRSAKSIWDTYQKPGNAIQEWTGVPLVYDREQLYGNLKPLNLYDFNLASSNDSE